jgi:sulfonate transport system permease protein
VMAVSRIADRSINPLYHAIRQVPLMGLIPLISLWFGNGESSKLFIVSLAAFYPSVLNTYEGLRNTDAKYIAVASVYRLSAWQRLRCVTLPSALPSIFTGLMQATAFTWLSSVGSEFFFNPGPGLGNMMLNGQAAFRMDVVMVSVAAIGLTGFAMNTLIVFASRRALRWRSTRQA